MPLKKSYKKSYKKKAAPKSWYNQRFSALQIAKKALSATNYMRGMINCEKKYHTAYTNFTVPTTGYIAALSMIPQGDSNVTRDGNSVLARSLLLNIDVTKNINVANTKMKIALVQDTGFADNASSITASTIYDSALVGTQYAPLAPVALNTQGRYKVVRSFDFTLNSTYSTKRISEFIKLYTHLKFDGTAGDQTSLNRNCFYLVCISDEDTNMPSIEMVSKLGFYDN